MKNIKLVIGLLRGYYYPSFYTARKMRSPFPQAQALLNAILLTWRRLDWGIPMVKRNGN